MAWITLTQPDGNAVQINSDQIVRVRNALPGDLPMTKGGVDLTNGQSQPTRETPAEIMQKILH